MTPKQETRLFIQSLGLILSSYWLGFCVCIFFNERTMNKIAKVPKQNTIMIRNSISLPVTTF